MICETCKHWKATFAPYVKHAIPMIMTCDLDGTVERSVGACEYWESANEKQSRKENSSDTYRE